MDTTATATATTALEVEVVDADPYACDDCGEHVPDGYGFYPHDEEKRVCGECVRQYG